MNPLRTLLAAALFSFSTTLEAADTAPTSATPSTPANTVAAARAELEAMHATDQPGRLQVIEAEKQHGRNSAPVRELWTKQSAIDQQNIGRLEAIVAAHGWPKRSVFGAKAASAAFLILQHADLGYQKKYLPMVREAAAANEMQRSSLALLEDRVRLREGKSQIYGSQVRRNAKDEWEPTDLEDPANVDARRATVGLQPLADYLEGFAKRSGGKVSPAFARPPVAAPPKSG
jgi:hypothetical protein